VDTALNTAVSVIDRIKDTSTSHRRAMVVEVLGRDFGFLEAMSAIAGMADAVMVPESEPGGRSGASQRGVRQGHAALHGSGGRGRLIHGRRVPRLRQRGQGAYQAALTVLGHIQSSGSPIAFDRILAARLGAATVEALADGEAGTMVGLSGDRVERVPLDEVVGEERPLDLELYRLAGVLAALPE
jgi:6-phosphofructokinase 1